MTKLRYFRIKGTRLSPKIRFQMSVMGQIHLIHNEKTGYFRRGSSKAERKGATCGDQRLIGGFGPGIRGGGGGGVGAGRWINMESRPSAVTLAADLPGGGRDYTTEGGGSSGSRASGASTPGGGGGGRLL